MHRLSPDLLHGIVCCPGRLALRLRALAWLAAFAVLAISGVATAQDTPAAAVTLTEQLEVRGMDCVPQVQEVETRRPIPIICQTDSDVAGVELRYRAEGVQKKWEKLELEQTDTGWTGVIPCAATAHKGTLKVYVFARNEERKVVARMGRNTAPMNIRLVESSKLPPPALPNKEAPDRCFDKSECPPEMIGTKACPGTKVAAATKLAWGASCAESGQCATGLACVAGSCETPPKCDNNEECPSGGECTDGVCHYPTAEELADRLGPPKHHWFGIHLGADISFLREATGVCGGTTEDSKSYACFKGGNIYTGVPNGVNSGSVASSPHLATLRALLSYEFVFKRFSLGARAGWAFRGSPKDFSPVHIELRTLYSLRQDPLNNRFRPYLGLAGGYAEVDTPVGVKIVDCIDAATVDACAASASQADINARLAAGTAVRRDLDAYRQGGTIFFGPTLSLMYAFTNEAAMVFNLNVMLPEVAFSPSLGYTMGI